MSAPTLYEGGNVPAGGDDLLITSKKILGKLWDLSSGGGGVNSVGLTAPAEFVVNNSPITTAGDISLLWADVSEAPFLAGAADGSIGAPFFRNIVVNDIPGLPGSKITTGTIAADRLGSGATSSKFLKGDSSWQTLASLVTSGLPSCTSVVDATNGNDGTAVAGRFDLPFATISAAITATSSPNGIYVRNGSYSDQLTVKNGVPMYFEQGAVVTYSGATGGVLIYPGTSGEIYEVFGRGQFICDNSAGGAAAVFGGVSGAGRMVLEADVVKGQGTNGNRAMDLTTSQIDPNAVNITPSYIKILYVESNNKVSNYAVDIDWAGGPAFLWFGTINNISTTSGSRAFEIESQGGLGDYCLELFIDKVVDTASTASAGQDSVHLINNGGGVTPFRATINYIQAGNKGALGIGSDVEVRSRVIQNNSSSVPTINGAYGRILDALIQNVSNNSTSTPIIDTNIYDDQLMYSNCRFENPNSNPSDSVIKLANFANTFVRFKNCVFYLAGTDADGLINLEKTDGVAFIGDNIIVRRTGSAPSIGASAAKTARVYGTIFASVDKDAETSVADGSFVFDSGITLGNSIGNYFA